MVNILLIITGTDIITIIAVGTVRTIVIVTTIGKGLSLMHRIYAQGHLA
jgi:hypothetical protein